MMPIDDNKLWWVENSELKNNSAKNWQVAKKKGKKYGIATVWTNHHLEYNVILSIDMDCISNFQVNQKSEKEYNSANCRR